MSNDVPEIIATKIAELIDYERRYIGRLEKVKATCGDLAPATLAMAMASDWVGNFEDRLWSLASSTSERTPCAEEILRGILSSCPPGSPLKRMYAEELAG